VVVTGGTGALGRAAVTLLLERGAIVHLPGYEAARPTHFGLAEHPQVHCQWGIDLSDESRVVGYYEDLPPLWASVHCTGGFAMAEVTATSLADVERMWRMNAVS